MGFKSFLSAIGHGAEKVIKYIASDQGQKTIQVAEAAAVTVGTAVGGPGLGAGIAGIELLINKAFAGVISMEATATTLGAQSGTGAQKGAAVAAALSPQVEQLLKDLGYDNPTADQVENIANLVTKSIADIVNTIPPPAALVSPATGGTAQIAPAPAQATTGMVSR